MLLIVLKFCDFAHIFSRIPHVVDFIDIHSGLAPGARRLSAKPLILRSAPVGCGRHRGFAYLVDLKGLRSGRPVRTALSLF